MNVQMTAILKQQVISCWVQQIWCVEQMHLFLELTAFVSEYTASGTKKEKHAVLLMNVSK